MGGAWRAGQRRNPDLELILTQEFVRQRKVLRLVFDEGHDLHGLEVLTRPPNTRKVLDLVKGASGLGELFQAFSQSGSDGDIAGQLDKLGPLSETFDELEEAFAAALVSWNYKVEALDGSGASVEVPARRDCFDQLEGSDLQLIIMAWFKQVKPTTPDTELGKGSPSGVTFPEGSLPMAPLSPSLSSLSVPA